MGFFDGTVIIKVLRVLNELRPKPLTKILEYWLSVEKLRLKEMRKKK